MVAKGIIMKILALLWGVALATTIVTDNINTSTTITLTITGLGIALSLVKNHEKTE